MKSCIFTELLRGLRQVVEQLSGQQYVGKDDARSELFQRGFDRGEGKLTLTRTTRGRRAFRQRGD